MARSTQDVLAAAAQAAKELSDEYVSTEHLLLALARKGDATLVGLLAARDVTAEKLEAALVEVRGNRRVTTAEPESTFDALEKYARDLTAEASAGKLDPVIGRDQEIRRAIQVLSRRRKNNPVLIGDPGVGKTAIVEGWPTASSTATCPRASRASASWRSTWAPCSLARSTAASSRSASRPCSTRSHNPRARSCCSSTSCTRWWEPAAPRARSTRPTCSSPPRSRRAALHRRDDAGRVPQVHREGTRRWSGASFLCSWASPRSRTRWPSCVA